MQVSPIFTVLTVWGRGRRRRKKEDEEEEDIPELHVHLNVQHLKRGPRLRRAGVSVHMLHLLALHC